MADIIPGLKLIKHSGVNPAARSSATTARRPSGRAGTMARRYALTSTSTSGARSHHNESP